MMNLIPVLSLPDVLYRIIWSYLSDEERIQFGSCCKTCSQGILRSIRSITISLSKWIKDGKFQKLIRMLPRVLECPISNINFIFDVMYWNDGSPSLLMVNSFLEACHHSLCRVEGNFVQLSHICNLIPLISLTELTLLPTYQPSNLIIQHSKNVFDCLQTKIRNLEKLEINLNYLFIQIPHISSLKGLSLYRSAASDPLPSCYFSQLTQLKLENCQFQDVSLLGNIPSLELIKCPYITDISALNNNHSIKVIYCIRIQDFSCSFANSEVIEIFVATKSNHVVIDLMYWKKVTQLTLLHWINDFSIQFKGSRSIPWAVKKCCLQGNFVDGMDLQISEQHLIDTLTLLSSSSIRSFTGLGFERLKVFQGSDLQSLVSLDGLGGKNQKIILRSCPEVTSFTPLKDIQTVEIRSCRGFTTNNCEELKGVCQLTIVSRFSFSFQNVVFSRLQSLVLFESLTLETFEGLENIVNLTVTTNHLQPLRRFLENGGQLRNSRLEFIIIGNEELLHDLYQVFLSPLYFSFHKKQERMRSIVLVRR